MLVLKAMADINKKDNEAKYWYLKRSDVELYDRLRFSTIKGKLYAFLQRRIIEKMLNLIPAKAKVLDIPCGTGRMLPFLLKRGYHIHAGDVSEEMISFSRKRVGYHPNLISIKKMDIERLDYADNEFDCIFCIKLMHLVPQEVRARILKELHRVTNKHVVVTYPYYSFTTRLIHFIKRIFNIGTIQCYAMRIQDIYKEINEAHFIVKKKGWPLKYLSEEVVLLIEKT